VATTIQIAHGTDGVVNAAKPLIWGTARADSTVTLFDGGKAIATVETDQEGWWGLTPGVLSSGAHQLTAQVNDQFGRASPLSAAVDVRVAATAGISYVVGSVSDKSGQALDVGKLQAVLDAVSALTSSVLDGTQTISLKVSVGEVTAEDYIAAAGAKFHSAASDAGMPSITDARLDLSPEFAKAINEGKFLTSYAIEVLTHEMMHVLGMNADPSSAYQAQVKKVGADWYYEGFSARALNGGSVLLASDGTHLPEYSWDLMDPTYRSYIDYLKSDNQTAPYSALDLAILKQLGYHNKDTLVSDDGHRYLAGNGKAGHDTVTGIAGRDTLYVDGKTTGHTINLTSTGFNVKDNVGDGGTLKLSGIERIYFNDNPVALDVGTGQIGGMTYRLYQAAFDRAPDKAGLGYWIDSMDRGLSLKAVAHEFMASKEFAKLYGAKPSDADFLGQLYGNVLHRKPDSAGQAYWLDQMQHGQTKEDVLVNFSESKENVAQLVGVLQNGFAYEYYRGA
jgi:hypothetical protein